MNNKIIPYWYDLILALAKDFESENITWKDLYDRMFVPGTDINNTMVFALQGLGVDHRAKISIKEIETLVKSVTYEYEVIEDNDQDFVLVKNTSEKNLINPKEKDGVTRALNRLGYRGE